MMDQNARPIALPIELVCTGGPLPAILRGRLAHLLDGVIVVDVDQTPIGVAEGQKAILNIIDGKAPRVLGSISRIDGRRITLLQTALRERERRIYPRLLAGLPLRFRLPPRDRAGEEAVAWLRGEVQPEDLGAWQVQDNLTNFSVTGLSFDAAEPAQGGDLILIELGMPGRDERWRCTGLIIRVFDVPADEVDANSEGAPCNYRYALTFEVIPHAAQTALSDLTMELQAAMI
jgi:hypothetical protein